MKRHLPTLAATLAAALAFLPPTTPAPAADEPQPERVRCDGAVQHPLTARVAAEGPVVRGATLALRVEVSTRTPLESVRVRIADAGTGAAVLGASELALGALVPGTPGAAAFTVRVPEKEHRALVQFLVSGEGPGGTITRGATYNILPDGPADPGRLVTGSRGVVREYAAGRIR